MLAGHARHDLSFNTCIVFINVAGFFQNNDQAIHRVHNRGGGGGGYIVATLYCFMRCTMMYV